MPKRTTTSTLPMEMQFAFDPCRFDYSVIGEQVILSDIYAESKDFLKLKGTLEMVKKNASGTFQVGLSPDTLARLPQGATDIFSKEEEGYYWTPVQVSARDGKWEDDLTPRLTKLFITDILSNAEKVTDVVEDFLKTLQSRDKARGKNNSPNEKSTIEQLLEKGSKALGTDVKSLFDLLGN